MAQKHNDERERSGKGKPSQVRPEQLRETARRIQYEILPSIYSLLEAPVPNTQGDLKLFPRPSSEDQAALAGVEVIREVGEKLALVLHAVAAGLERKQELNPALENALQPVIAALHAK
jgi:hypothetical protein